MSRAGLVIPRLLDIWTPALAPDFPTVDVNVGPLISGSGDDAVFIGYEGDPFGDFESIVHTQQWGALGQKSRDEEFDVHCCVLNIQGSSTAKGVAAAFTRLYAEFTVLLNAVHADPSLGLGPPTTPVFVADVRNFASFMPMNGEAVEPRISFNVHCRTRM